MIPIRKVISLLRKQKFNATALSKRMKEPYKVLISCIISLRTKDKVTEEASERLFGIASTPGAMSRISIRRIEKAIYPAGFYRTKAKQIRQISKELCQEHNSVVPSTIEELLKFKGVGRKTANIVVTIGYNKLGIAVDTHVHRISNRIGYVKTKNPEQTEFALRQKLPQRYWIEYNDLLVQFGQNVCLPVSPRCSKCVLNKLCPKVGVVRHR